MICQVEIDLPDGAVVSGSFVLVEFIRDGFEDHEVAATRWHTEGMSDAQLIGHIEILKATMLSRFRSQTADD